MSVSRRSLKSREKSLRGRSSDYPSSENLTFDGVFAGGGTSFCAAAAAAAEEDMAWIARAEYDEEEGEATARGREREAARRERSADIRVLLLRKSERKK